MTWDAYVSNTQQRGVDAAIRSLTGRPSVTAWSAGYSGVPLTVQGVRADAIAMLPGHHGALLPVPVRGPSAPRARTRSRSGSKTLAAIHARVGQTVAVSLDGFRPGRLRIVGTAVFPTISDVARPGQGCDADRGRAAPPAAAGAARPAARHPARPVPSWCRRPVRAERLRGPGGPAGPVRRPGPGHARPTW